MNLVIHLQNQCRHITARWRFSTISVRHFSATISSANCLYSPKKSRDYNGNHPVVHGTPLLCPRAASRPHFVDQRRTFHSEIWTAWVDASHGFWRFAVNCNLTQWIESGLLQVHDWSHAPWWLIIAVYTFLLKICMFPIVQHTHRMALRYGLVQQQLQPLMKEAKMKAEFDQDRYRHTPEEARRKYAETLVKIKKDLYRTNRCKPQALVLGSVLQFPFWICTTMAMRNIVGLSWQYQDVPTAPSDAVTTEGLFWFADLATPDPFYLLPVFGCVIGLSMSLVNRAALQRAAKAAGMREGPPAHNLRMIYVHQAASLAMLVVASIQPAGVAFYWFCSGVMHFSQVLLLRLPAMRKLLNMPDVTEVRAKLVRVPDGRTLSKTNPKKDVKSENDSKT